jgi:hypothetical protein
MTPDELRQRIADHEDNFTERKPQGASPREWRRTMVAFVNSVPEGRTAHLIIGVADDGTILGCSDPDSIQKTIRKVCEQDRYPPIAFTSEVVTVLPGPVVIVSIPSSANRPHFSGPAYIRRGSESVAASEQVFNELVHSRNSKAAAILKLKNQVVIVIGLGHQLGSTRRRVTRDHHEGGEARILECNAQTVRFQMIGSQVTMTEPLDHVQITYDEEKWKPKLVFTGYWCGGIVKTPPGEPSGVSYRLFEHRLLGPAPVSAEALAVLVLDQDGVDGTLQTRKVEGEAEIIAVVVGGLGPGLTDLRTPDKDAVAGRLGIAVGIAGLLDDANALGGERDHKDLAFKAVAVRLECADVCHCRLLLVSSPRPSRPRWRSTDTDGRRRTRRAAAQRRMPAANFLDLREEERSDGEESLPRHCGIGAPRRSRSGALI